METQEEGTPVKRQYEVYETDSPSGLYDQPPETSPACVKWDFLLPTVAEEVKTAANKLHLEIAEHDQKRRRMMRVKIPRVKIGDRLNNNGGNSMPTSPQQRSFRQLKESLNGLSNKILNGEMKPVDNYTSESSGECSHAVNTSPLGRKRKHEASYLKIKRDIFNDSLDCYMVECSQAVESAYLKREKHISSHIGAPSTSKSDTENSSSPKIKDDSPKSRMSADELFKSQLHHELNGKDDDLFFNIDLDELYKK